MAFDNRGLPYRSVGKFITDGAETTIFTCNGKQAHIAEIRVAKGAGGTGAVTLKWVDSSLSITHFIVKSAAVAANVPLIFPFAPLVLDNGDTLLADPDDSDDWDIIVSYVEYAGRSA